MNDIVDGALDGAAEVPGCWTMQGWDRPVPPRLDDLPRVGVRLHAGAGVARVDWMGLGPHECYSDRRASGRYGRWSTAVEDWGVPYVHPQASGDRMDVRRLRLIDGGGRILLAVDAIEPLQVTVKRHTEEEIAAAGHLDELPDSDDRWLWRDAAHRGVGSGAVGPPLPVAHRVRSGTYRWTYPPAGPEEP